MENKNNVLYNILILIIVLILITVCSKFIFFKWEKSKLNEECDQLYGDYEREANAIKNIVDTIDKKKKQGATKDDLADLNNEINLHEQNLSEIFKKYESTIKKRNSSFRL